MARYTGPRVRISRRFGIPIFGPTKYLERRNYGPGVHGPKSRRKHTDYGLGLIEKQKLRYYYGLMERQFRGVYEKALQPPRRHRRADAADSGNPPGQRGVSPRFCQHPRRRAPDGRATATSRSTAARSTSRPTRSR